MKYNMDDNYILHFHNDKWYGCPVSVDNKPGNENEKHFFLKKSLGKILQMHMNMNVSYEQSDRHLRYDLYAKNDKHSAVGEIGKFSTPVRKLNERMWMTYETSNLLFWIPYCGGYPTNDQSTSYMCRIMDEIFQKYKPETCPKYPEECCKRYGWLPRLLILFKEKFYRIMFFDLEHMFNPKIWHRKH